MFGDPAELVIGFERADDTLQGGEYELLGVCLEDHAVPHVHVDHRLSADRDRNLGVLVFE